MGVPRALFVVLAFHVFFGGVYASADDGRTQYPVGLKNSFVDFGLANMRQPFSGDQLEPGYGFGTVRQPLVGARISIGHNFTKNLSAQIVYARPVQWVRYENVTDSGGGTTSHSMITNLSGLTVRTTAPIGGPFSAYFEGGLGIVTRGPVRIFGDTAVRDTNFATTLWGAGLKYRLSDAWDLRAGVDYSPPKGSVRQPSTTVFSTSAVLNLRPLPRERVRANAASGAVFPKNLFQVGHATNELGTGVNHFFSGGPVPIFWGGSAEVARGITLRYQRNVFHTRRVFSLDVAGSVSSWWSAKNVTNFWTFSAYPQFRFTPIRTKSVDFYAYYSTMGPAYISRSPIDGRDTARKFTFQDLMGAGCYVRQRGGTMNVDVSIGHYSNGNLTPHNTGVKIPLTVSMGIAF